MTLSSEMLKAITPEVYQRFKTAVEIKKWPNGETLSSKQLNTCMQAIIIYEQENFPPEQRTGYMPTKETPCDSKDDRPLTWKN